MAFSDLPNLDNRSRHRVRGRVIVFTDSYSVEYVDNALTICFPLWTWVIAEHRKYIDTTTGYYRSTSGGSVTVGIEVGQYPLGHGVTFVVELDGYLTFDGNAYVRILEVGPFNQFMFDPSLFTVVKPAETPHAQVFEAYVGATNDDGDMREVSLWIKELDGRVRYLQFSITPHMPYDKAEPFLEKLKAKYFLGENGYTKYGMTYLYG